MPSASIRSNTPRRVTVVLGRVGIERGAPIDPIDLRGMMSEVAVLMAFSPLEEPVDYGGRVCPGVGYVVISGRNSALA